jgi:hypothetical protein
MKETFHLIHLKNNQIIVWRICDFVLPNSENLKVLQLRFFRSSIDYSLENEIFSAPKAIYEGEPLSYGVAVRTFLRMASEFSQEKEFYLSLYIEGSIKLKFVSFESIEVTFHLSYKDANLGIIGAKEVFYIEKDCFMRFVDSVSKAGTT